MKRKTSLLIVALLALTLAGSATAESNGPPAANTYTGTLTVIVGDPMPIEGEPMTPIPPIFTLHLDDGRELRLLPGAAGENDLLRLAGQQVSVTLPAAEAESALAADDPAAPGVAVTSADLAPGAIMASPEVTGNTKWLTIACKFADVADEPRPLSYFQNMYANTYPGLDHYWREASYGAINLVGSTAVGWYTLPYPIDYYRRNDWAFDGHKLFADCSALADPYINFGEYMGVNLAFNASLGCCAWAGSTEAQLDGVTRTWLVTFLPDWAYFDIAILIHEMAHGYGIPWHSFARGSAYGDPWDVMGCSLCPHDINSRDPVYGWTGQHTQIYYRDYLGWVAAGRKLVVGPGVTTLTLERTTQPPATGYLMAVVPIDGSATHFYAIEARQRVGHDVQLQGPSITIHEIGGPGQPVVLMDPLYEAGVISHLWAVGDTWLAPQGNITVYVDAATPTGFTITINTNWETRMMTLVPTGDTTLDQSTPNTNYGVDSRLRIEGSLWNPNGATKAIIMKFDPAQLPAHISRARLNLFSVVPLNGEQLSVMALCKQGVGYGPAWSEQSLTWNSYQSQQWWCGSTLYIDGPTSSGADWFEWDISGIITVAGSQAVNTLMVDDSRDYPLKTFSSREGARPPVLIIDYLVPSEPPTTTTTFLPTNDATVNQAKPRLISGGKPTLQVKDAAKDLNSYVKFNLTGLTGAVQSATLRLWVTNGGPDGGRVYTTSPFYLNTTTQWLETGLKWSNAPAIGGAALDSAGAVTTGRWIELDVTGAITGNGRVSFALSNDSTDLVVYSSKEGAHAPELVIVTD